MITHAVTRDHTPSTPPVRDPAIGEALTALDWAQPHHARPSMTDAGCISAVVLTLATNEKHHSRFYSPSPLQQMPTPKSNLDKPIFAKLPGTNRWALHDFRTQFHENTVENPMMDG